MSDAHILVTGGSGLLGTALQKAMPRALYPASDEFNVCDPEQMRRYVAGRDITTVFHGAAFTSPPKIDENPIKALDSNIAGTANVVKLCFENGWRLVYISTDYVFKGDKGRYGENDEVLPQNKYAWSKLGGECAVRLYDNSLIVRTSLGEDEFPYPKAFVDQWTSRQPVTAIAAKLVEIIRREDLRGVLHVGGERRTIMEYAREISPGKDIGELSINDVAFTVPVDTSLDTARYKSLFKESK
ncbi:SDR family oxidoreductase [Pseudodesulfovibrio karagichevae]|uniref:dTDP-4-dehydrorhamnose reductase n=1 Tax=Pseudodesulfovibrio karagichevae TaxID=3239305 RepID=A0ABV4K3U3_9BACT